jgi:predicted metalloenzyme YecM
MLENPLSLAIACAAAAGVATLIVRLTTANIRRRGKLLLRASQSSGGGAPLIYKLKNQYYQVLGHAWDHGVKDFQVVYRPLYHCAAASDRFEAHVLAVSHFQRWNDKFERVTEAELATLPPSVLRLVLPGPFWSDPQWPAPALTEPLPAAASTTRSGLGSRSHEPPLIEHLIGDYRAFIGAVDARLRHAGCDARARGYEMDHICYRVESVTHYRQLRQALVPAFGTLLIETMIGGRPISVIELDEALEHRGFTVRCLELPCPKPGRPYVCGLEHAELVVCDAACGARGNAGLRAWIEACRAEGCMASLLAGLDTRALGKSINADVCVELPAVAVGDGPTRGDGGPPTLAVKFHQRPLYEVVGIELAEGSGEAVPEGYFESAEEAERLSDTVYSDGP